MSSAKVLLNNTPAVGLISPASSCMEPEALVTKRAPRLIERLWEHHVDGRADGARGQRDIRRLHHAQRADEVGTHRAEVNRTSASTAVEMRRPSYRCFVEVAAEAAHRDAGRLASHAVALNRDAWHALQGCRKIRVWKLADVLG